MCIMAMLPLLVARIVSGVGEELSTYDYPIYAGTGAFGNFTPNQISYRSETLETGEVLQHIGFFDQIQNGAPKTLKTLFDNTVNIRSTIGKTAKIVLILQSRFGGSDVRIRSSNTVDTADGTILLTLNNLDWSNDQYLTIDGISLTPLGFLTIEVTSASGNVDVETGVIIREA